jgi:hypothetical protein
MITQIQSQWTNYTEHLQAPVFLYILCADALEIRSFTGSTAPELILSDATPFHKGMLNSPSFRRLNGDGMLYDYR